MALIREDDLGDEELKGAYQPTYSSKDELTEESVSESESDLEDSKQNSSSKSEFRALDNIQICTPKKSSEREESFTKS